ncbi:MAG: hypothetical protein HKN77_00645 [Woeseiaceae bacterium]|nr:hypothetical protein [Woeseiaceae bacterium]
MRTSRISSSLRSMLGSLILGILAAGCVTAPKPEIIAEPEPVPVVEPVVVAPTVPVVKEPEPEPEPVTIPPPPPQSLPSVAIVLDNRNPAYEAVVTELGKHFDAYSIYDFSDKSQPPVIAFRAINDEQAVAVIAIGLRAAKSAIALSKSPVIFSQIFNYQDHGLVTEKSRGISAIAPVDAQLGAWKALDPMLNEVGLIIGEGHEGLIEDARIAAEQFGIALTVQVSNSDQETLYFYKRMVSDIDGFWMMPDNRILSRRVIREILADAKRRNVVVAVPNDSMLPMGAGISFTASASNVAEQIVAAVRRVQAGEFDELPEITPLTDLNIATNDAVLQKRVVASKVQSEQEVRQ